MLRVCSRYLQEFAVDLYYGGISEIYNSVPGLMSTRICKREKGTNSVAIFLKNYPIMTLHDGLS